MAHAPLAVRSVIPEALARVLPESPAWFVIGGQAVRCFCPYRPTTDVDLGVADQASLAMLVAHFETNGGMTFLERNATTVHAIWQEIHVSLFVLDRLVPFTEDHRLTVEGILATKLHAIVDRGTRRDFFDLYVMLQSQRLGIASALAALRTVYANTPVRDTLLLRALTFFDDAEREASLPGESERDWAELKSFFLTQVGQLLVPPTRQLAIQSQRVDVD